MISKKKTSWLTKGGKCSIKSSTSGQNGWRKVSKAGKRNV